MKDQKVIQVVCYSFSLEAEVKKEKEREDVLRSIRNVEKKKSWMEYKVKETKKQEVT